MVVVWSCLLLHARQRTDTQRLLATNCSSCVLRAAMVMDAGLDMACLLLYAFIPYKFQLGLHEIP